MVLLVRALKAKQRLISRRYIEVAKEPGVLTIALAGNPNVGKSVIFNQLTGLAQFVGNWPGKTVEIAEGYLYYAGKRIKVVDLPGTYSLSAFSAEELVARDYIVLVKPDIVVDIIDASAFERNLYLTLQLMELNAPLIIILNQVDVAAKRGIAIDHVKLSELLKIPVVQMVAITGKGLSDFMALLAKVISESGLKVGYSLRYCEELEKYISDVEGALRKYELKRLRGYPLRWVAIKLLEGDEEVKRKIAMEAGEVVEIAEEKARDIERVFRKPASVVFASERYRIASEIAKQVVKPITEVGVSLTDKLDAVLMHGYFGYIPLALIMSLVFTTVFTVGGFIEELLGMLFESYVIPGVEALLSSLPSALASLIQRGVIEGIVAGITIIIPYISIFYLALSILEDSGYIPRAAFLMDNLLHKVGLHGKAFIPLVLGYGCNVPACLSCRIMETERERLLLSVLVLLVPCAARTVIILGVVGKYIGVLAALAIYAFDLALIFLVGRMLFKTLPGEPVGLIMELPPYRRPMLKVVLNKTWIKTRDFIYIALPIIVLGSIALEALRITGLLSIIVQAMAPFINMVLGLPGETGIPLIFGFLRKELILVLLYEYVGERLDLFMNQAQMIVFTLVMMIYIPCVATYAAMVKEIGLKKATLAAFFTVILALVVGALAYRVLAFFLA
ncbi:MAG: ferrous iron transport protein B [Candidatus Methanomethylicota archaeon]|uniref:Ferrous iron transport protein B n=1 Tax=Thermoproteota archaeon TaxID=2056631 RepID=A0A497EWP7_9CREN|nr:MAG: ferrous iron transport protein B [Candidatus Verstraetearchaeota archaeon]